MQQREGRMSRGKRIGFGLVALASVTVAVACGTRIPGNVVADSSNGDMPQLAALDSIDGSNYVADTTNTETITFEADQLEPDARARLRARAFDVKYPLLLRSAQVEGVVMARFIVGLDGRVDMNSLEIVRSDHALFSDAVTRALAAAEYVPARVDGKSVQQRLEQPFVFALSQRTADAASDSLSAADHDPTVLRPAVGSLASVEEWRKFNLDAKIKQSNANRDSDTYLENQVEKPAAMVQGQTGLVYPEMLRIARVEGTGIARFVVNERGEVEMSTFEIIRSDHDLFSHAVRTGLEKSKFLPAEVNGVKVRQLVHFPFQFSLAR